MPAMAEYGEALPDSCPPAEAADTQLNSVFRMVATNPPTTDCFASHFAKGKPMPKAANLTDCEWASCSLNTSVDELKKIKRLRKRFPYVAELTIPAGSGHHLSGKYHIHFWRFNGVDLAQFVTNVEQA